MSIQSAPYYWIVCDGDGCEQTSTEGSEHTAWSDQEGAEEDAYAGEWVHTDDGRWLCVDCRIAWEDDE